MRTHRVTPPIVKEHPVVTAGKTLDALLAQQGHTSFAQKRAPGAFRMAAQWTIGNSTRIARGTARFDEVAKLKNAAVLLNGWVKDESTEIAPELRAAAGVLLKEIHAAKLTSKE